MCKNIYNTKAEDLKVPPERGMYIWALWEFTGGTDIIHSFISFHLLIHAILGFWMSGAMLMKNRSYFVPLWRSQSGTGLSRRARNIWQRQTDNYLVQKGDDYHCLNYVCQAPQQPDRQTDRYEFNWQRKKGLLYCPQPLRNRSQVKGTAIEGKYQKTVVVGKAKW